MGDRVGCQVVTANIQELASSKAGKETQVRGAGHGFAFKPRDESLPCMRLSREISDQPTTLERVVSLNFVEVVLELEEAFKVQIPDETLQTAGTVQDLADVVVKEMKKKGAATPEDEARVLEKVIATIAVRIGVDPSIIKPDSDLNRELELG
jgi:acyl carrier protein